MKCKKCPFNGKDGCTSSHCPDDKDWEKRIQEGLDKDGYREIHRGPFRIGFGSKKKK